ncbi:hypothetical protein EMIT0347P_20454 [Pseudomonas sp. IT-347P]
MIPGTETRTSALARVQYGVVHLLHVVVLNNCYAIASQRGEAAKTGRLLDDIYRVDHKRLENFR